jgi:hypothetical protein
MALLTSAAPTVLRQRFGRWIAAIALSLAATRDTAAESTAFSEYQLKAVFLYNFAHFVEWPATAFSDSKGAIVIGVLGTDPFGAALDDVVAGEKVNDHPLSVRRFRRVEEVDGCHILFISQSENERLGEIFERFKGRSILLVGESEGFAIRGGMVRFITERNRVRLRINLEAAKAAGLVISSKLLRPAEIVTTEKKG